MNKMYKIEDINTTSDAVLYVQDNFEYLETIEDLMLLLTKKSDKPLEDVVEILKERVKDIMGEKMSKITFEEEE